MIRNKKSLWFGLSLYVSLSFLASVSKAEVDPSLVGWWRFDEGEGEVVKDSSSCGNHGQVIGAVRVKGIAGSGLKFNGEGSYVIIPHSDSLNLVDEMSIEMWVKWEKAAGHLFSKQAGNGLYGWRCYLFSYQDSPCLAFSCGGGAQSPKGTYLEARDIGETNEWHHLVFTFKTRYRLTIYLDGQQVAIKKRKVQDLTSFEGPLYIGAYAGGSRGFSGVLDEVKIYKKVLSPNEVQKNFMEAQMEVIETPIETVDLPGLIGYWPLNEGKGRRVYDHSPKQNHGRIFGPLHWLKGEKGVALQFYYPPSYVSIPHQDYLNLNNEFTLSAWIYPVGSIKGDHAIISKGRYQIAGFEFLLSYGRLRFHFMLGHDGRVKKEYCIYSSQVIRKPNTWYHVAVTYSQKNHKVSLYVNGENVGGQSLIGGEIIYNPLLHKDLPYSTLPITISGMAAYPLSYFQFKGFIREVKIYDYALSPAEVKSDYQKNIEISQLKIETLQEKYEKTLTCKIKGQVLDAETGKPIYAQISVHDKKRHYFPKEECLVANDSRDKRNFGWFFPFGDSFEVKCPPGKYEVVVLRGSEYEPQIMQLTLEDGETQELTIKLKRLINMPRKGWYSGDDEYQPRGHSWSKFEELPIGNENVHKAWKVCQAVGLNWTHFVCNMPQKSVRVSQEFLAGSGVEAGNRLLGDVICLNTRPRKRITYFNQLEIIDDIMEQGGVVNFAESIEGPIEQPVFKVSCRGLAVAVALGKAHLWRHAFDHWFYGGDPTGYRFLNLGFKMSAAGGTDTYTWGRNFGIWKVYVKIKDLTWEEIIEAYKKQRIFVTTGPMVIFRVNGKDVGETIILSGKEKEELHCSVEAFHLYGVKKVEIVKNGQVIKEILPDEGTPKHMKKSFTIPIDSTCWLAARVYGVRGRFYGNKAHTAPFYIQFGDDPLEPNPEDIKYFVTWLEKLKKAISGLGTKKGWKPEEYAPYFSCIDEARRVYEGLESKPRTWQK